MAGKFYNDRKKKIQSSVCWVRGSGDYDRKKKDTVVCLAGCAVVLCQFLVWREIGSFFLVAGNFYYDRKKKHVCLSCRDRYICISST